MSVSRAIMEGVCILNDRLVWTVTFERTFKRVLRIDRKSSCDENMKLNRKEAVRNDCLKERSTEWWNSQGNIRRDVKWRWNLI